MHTGDVLELLHDPLGGTRAQGVGKREAPVILHLIEPEVAVVWKPAGIRSAGDFPGTLQSHLKLLLPSTATPLPPKEASPLVRGPMPMSRLESGCTGLTLVARTETSLHALTELWGRAELPHTFVALVHGHAPDEWKEGIVLELPPSRERGSTFRKNRASKRKAPGEQASAASADGARQTAAEAKLKGEGEGEEEEVDEEEEEEGEEGCESTPGAADVNAGAHPIHVRVLSVTDGDSPAALSTLELACGARRGRLCGDLCFVLRHMGFPVVADRHARRERAALPRFCAPLKNKAKPHISCVGVAASPLVRFSVPVPAKLLAATWSSHEAASRAMKSQEQGGDHDAEPREVAPVIL